MGRRSRLWTGAAAACALVAIVAGCGSGSSSSASAPATGSGTTTATTPGASSATFKSFQQCLAAHGVKGGFTPGGGRPSAGSRTPAQQQAFAACRGQLPAGGRPGGPGGARGARGAANGNPAFARYATCLKQHGVTLGKSNDTTTFAAASKACAKLAPSGAAAPAAP